MAQAVFGRRGSAVALPAASPPALAPDVTGSSPVVALRAQVLDAPDTDVLRNVPVLTFGILALLCLVFGLEKRFAFDLGKHSAMSRESLVAFGAISWNFLRSGDVWRVFLAPLLHHDTIHLISNSIALVFVGWRLETSIGCGWFAAIFVVSALGGVTGSVIWNPPDLISVGASGAIMGLIGALFTMSFRGGVDPKKQRRMRNTALRFGAPALLPVLLGTTGGHVDHAAHIGGLLTGCGTGLLLTILWQSETRWPASARLAAFAALTGLALSSVSGAYAAAHYRSHAVEATQVIPMALLEGAKAVPLDRSSELVTQYPNDPRAHLLEALANLKSKNLFGAENELRRVIAMVPDKGSPYRPLRDVATAYLALVLQAEKRFSEASQRAEEICGAKLQPKLQALLKMAKLCSSSSGARQAN